MPRLTWAAPVRYRTSTTGTTRKLVSSRWQRVRPSLAYKRRRRRLGDLAALSAPCRAESDSEPAAAESKPAKPAAKAAAKATPKAVADKPKDDTPKGDEEGSAKGDAGKTEKKERVKRGPSLYNKFMASELPTFKAKLENKAMTHNEAFGTVSTMVRHAARALPSVLGCRRERPGRAAGLG